MKLWKIKIHLISKEFFQYSLVTYLILLLAETLKQGIVSFFFNLNILLGIVLISGVVMVLTHNEKLDEKLKPEKKQKITAKDIEYIIILASGGAILVHFKTQDLGSVSIIISVITAIIIVLLSLLVLSENE